MNANRGALAHEKTTASDEPNARTTSHREEQQKADNNRTAQHRDYGALIVGQSIMLADAKTMDYV
jgi:hypothetical protein